MKPFRMLCSILIATAAWVSATATAQTQNPPATLGSDDAAAKSAAARAKSDAEQEKKAAEWVGSLKLADAAKEGRVTEVITTHLKTIRDWHNEHPYTTVPAGINPVTGKPLSQLDRQMIATSA